MADSNIIRVGKLSSINYSKGTARVTYEDKDQSTTTAIPFLAWQYWMPRVGDQVVVAHFSTGTCAAVILGPLWNDGNRPVEGFEGLYRKEYANEIGLANERYDAKEQAYSQNVTGSMETNASESWSVSVGSGAIQINQDGSISIASAAGITIEAASLHLIGDIKLEGKGEATDIFTMDSDVIAGKAKISLVEHTHTDSVGGDTTKPKE